MWKLIKSSYKATNGLVKLIGEGSALVAEGLDECNKGLENLNFKLENFNSEMQEIRPFKKNLHQLELCRLNIDLIQQRTPSIYKNSHYFYDLFKEIIDLYVNINRLAIKHPVCRHDLQNLLDEFKNGFPLLLSKDHDWQASIQQMHSNGLDENANSLETFCFYIKTHSNETLEVEAKEVMSQIPNSLKNAIDRFKQQFIEFYQ